MRTAVVLAAVFFGPVLAGCSNSDDSTGKPASHPATTGTATGTGTEQPPPPKTPPPVATSNPEFDGGLPATCDPGPADQIYSFSAENLSGTEKVPLCRFRGKVMMIVNVASECGNTPEYGPLQAFFEKYREQGFYVLGFPCNQFGAQEPGTAKEISDFCTQEYGITFPMFSKIQVNGAQQDVLYTWLKAQPGGSGDIEWNFVKFLIGRDGKLIKRYGDKVLNPGYTGSPTPAQVEADIVAAVATQAATN
jgi:glutathione peroxidase